MRFNDAKEHAPGRLHDIFAAPYAAFDNTNLERSLHLRIALEALLAAPCQLGLLALRVIHGWENGDYELEDLCHSDHPLRTRQDLHAAAKQYLYAGQDAPAFSESAGALLADPLDTALANAEAQGQTLDKAIRQHPARWPSFENGLYLYTFFKMYHRLTYGEDDPYRSIYCKTPQGDREIHEFHIEEGEFAVCTPPDPASRETTLLIMHASQLESLAGFLSRYL